MFIAKVDDLQVLQYDLEEGTKSPKIVILSLLGSENKGTS
jgi:hypothetical protein